MSWEMVLFSLALASRIKILRDERDTLQAQQIEVSEKARKALERSNRIKDDFLNAVSHELRTPLHTIQGQLDLLREAARAKPVTLVLSVHDSVPRKVFMDGLMLEKVLYQLIDNAVKFTPSGGQVMVDCTKSTQDSALQILISDTGPGIPKDQLSKVFQAFEQGDAGLTRRYGGVGLGLPLASSLATALDGRMAVMNGIEATREIRQKAAHNLDTPIIAITASASQSYRLQCLDAGMDDYYTKPLPMEKLKTLISTYAEYRKAERAKQWEGLKA